MKRKFSKLYIKNVEDIDMTKFSEFTSENEKFCEYFSYDWGENHQPRYLKFLNRI